MSNYTFHNLRFRSVEIQKVTQADIAHRCKSMGYGSGTCDIFSDIRVVISFLTLIDKTHATWPQFIGCEAVLQLLPILGTLNRYIIIVVNVNI